MQGLEQLWSGGGAGVNPWGPKRMSHRGARRPEGGEVAAPGAGALQGLCRQLWAPSAELEVAEGARLLGKLLLGKSSSGWGQRGVGAGLPGPECHARLAGVTAQGSLRCLQGAQGLSWWHVL